MEEGPEPQDMVERTAHEHHEMEHEEGSAHSKSFTTRSAITAAILAVFAAIASLLSGHAANQAILLQSQASDRWALYQAKSTKSHLSLLGQNLTETIARMSDKTGEAQRAELTAKYSKDIAKYDKEKEEVSGEATKMQSESAAEFAKHSNFALGVALFQVGIVLSSVSIMISRRWLYLGSLAAGAGGLVFAVLGFFQ